MKGCPHRQPFSLMSDFSFLSQRAQRINTRVCHPDTGRVSRNLDLRVNKKAVPIYCEDGFSNFIMVQTLNKTYPDYFDKSAIKKRQLRSTYFARRFTCAAIQINKHNTGIPKLI